MFAYVLWNSVAYLPHVKQTPKKTLPDVTNLQRAIFRNNVQVCDDSNLSFRSSIHHSKRYHICNKNLLNIFFILCGHLQKDHTQETSKRLMLRKVTIRRARIYLLALEFHECLKQLDMVSIRIERTQNDTEEPFHNPQCL